MDQCIYVEGEGREGKIGREGEGKGKGGQFLGWEVKGKG